MQDAQPFEDSLARFCSLALETAHADTMKSLREFADTLESKPEFDAVGRACSKLGRTEALSHGSTGADKFMLEAFLRRSGAYRSLYAGESPDITEIAGRFRALLMESHVTVTYLAPIDLIQLSRDRLEFESFAIRRFSRSELAVMTQNEIREAFYPWATLDLDILEDYWFLVARDTIPVRSAFDLPDLFDSRVGPLYTSHPEAIEKALYPIVLHDWVDQFHPSKAGGRPLVREPHDAPIYPHVPFVLALSASWLEVPKPAPPMGELARDPRYDEEGVEIGDSPCYAFFFNEARTNKLEEDLREFVKRLRLIERGQPEWRFMYTALGFLAKAFQTRGVEQLLWHITAIEAILGQRDAGLTTALKARIAEVFGRSVQEKKEFRKRFDDLYRFRSDLVHGNSDLDDQKINKGHLAEARDFARGVVAWSTGLLAHIAETYPLETCPVPTRENLLLLLDMDPKTRSSVGALLQNLPTCFPSDNDWLIYGKSAGFPWES